MRTTAIVAAAVLATSTHALRLPTIDLQPFLSALPISLQDYIPSNLSNQTVQHELLRRQSDNCPNDFRNCANLGAPGVCCASNAVCSADFAGNVACCPSGAACSGRISSVVTAGTVNSNGAVVGGAGAAAATTGTDNSDGLASATTTTDFQTPTSTNAGGLVAATTDDSNTAVTDDGSQGTNTQFVANGGTTVATPAAGVRRADIPLPARALIQALHYLPV
ncbi:hypothetical protein D0869_16158 [Hortaea werneckii]|uniref:Granulins domain-containing protein n=1 Tax=Hortaea werneckii TaxID=91943 RepID=A0A3M6VXF7_HORWE|nr:hypothetical protein KC334_g13360 [Hortaea werneckii]KAI6954300.1 hypothetical protein KC355_g13591 [Hortaea werneckii]KAI7119114.1 hypothetical protein KC324_g18643 [Hortaea werneckii]KAI7524974.1 hypothetical protein KC316_g18556 [Hortaea werneckii]KAI7655318.1 hypothetical protein KC318_g13060 [Hortaea werneckii]